MKENSNSRNSPAGRFFGWEIGEWQQAVSLFAEVPTLFQEKMKRLCKFLRNYMKSCVSGVFMGSFTGV
jgi:hypothetical protein